MHERVRLFTAGWPGAGVRARLAAESDGWRWPATARPVAAAKLHLTLHFIGAFPRDRVDALAAALAAVAAERTSLVASRREVWRGGIAVLLFDADAALERLHAAIGGVVAGFGVAIDPRPFAPHVTLARGARGAVPPGQPPAVDWDARGFALVESVAGDYRVLRTFGAAEGDGGGAPSDATR